MVVGDHPFSAFPKSNFGKPVPDSFISWTAHPWIAIATSGTQTCDLTAFALATSRKPVRLRADGVEQAIDNAWTFHETVETGVERRWTFEWFNPVDGALLACQQVSVACVNESGVLKTLRSLDRECPQP